MTLSLGERLPAPAVGVDTICDAFEAAWLAGHEPRIEDFLPGGASVHQDVLLRELLLAEWDLRRRHDQHIELQTYLGRFPESTQSITDLWRAWHESASDSILNAPAIDASRPLDEAAQEAVGTVIDRYKLLEKLGEGGFGTVWGAEQRQPVKRRIALKIIKLGMDTRQVVARFEAERQALALMDHANIAKVFDAGATQTGRPYFVMELVRGIPITRYCEQERLSTQARLNLFMKVCHAIQHAHQKGIIHRDIKPSNILVTLHDGVPIPKVIDFGVAKAIQQELTEKTIYTQLAQFIGTPAYMSPEQAEMSGLDIDTRSDVYSLGVLLYELLTGTTPFDAHELMRSGLDEMRKIIREKEPLTPSSRLTKNPHIKNAASEQSIDNLPRAAIDRDLDWIVMKCLEKDRTRRYETASALAHDLKRHLENEPVQACPPSVAYRFRKFARRNKAGLTTAVLVALALLVGAGVSTSQAWRAFRAATAQRQELELRLATEAKSRRLLYVTDIKLAHQLGETGNLQWVSELLNRQRPQPGQEDLRAFEWYYLDQLTRPSSSLLTLKGHTAQSHGTTYSPDGRRIAAAGEDHTVRVWDADTGREVLRLKGHTGPVYGVTFNPAGDRIATGGEGGVVKVWDAETGQERFAIDDDRNAWISRVVYSPDGRWIAAGVGLVVKVWSAETGRERLALRGHTGWIAGVVFSPDGLRLASGGDDGTVRIWEIETAKEVHTLKGHRGLVWGVAFNPDGRRLASGGVDRTVRIWDADAGRELSSLPELSQTVHSVIFSPDGQRLASAGMDRMVRIWDADTGGELATYKGHADAICQTVFSPDGRRIASSSWDGTVRVWDATANHGASRLEGHTEHVVFAAYSPAGPFLATAGRDRVVKIWDTTTRLELRTLRGHQDHIFAVAFSPDGRRLASASHDGTVKVWDAATGRELLTFAGHGNKVWGVAFSPDGRSIVSAGGANLSGDRSVRVWDVATGQERFRLDGHSTQVRWVAFSPDGRRIVSTGAFDGTVRLWDAATGRELIMLNTGSGQAGVAVFSPDGRSLAVTTQNGGTVKVWDALTGVERLTLRGHSGVVWGVAYSPDGRRIASGGTDKAVRIWDAATGQELLALKGHADAVTGLAFSPEGLQLASASHDRTIRLWDAAGDAHRSSSGFRRVREWSSTNTTISGENEDRPNE